MSQFLYFVEKPETNVLTVESVRKLGLGYAIGAGSIAQSGCNTGPGGEPGVILQFQPAGAVAASPRYKPDVQRWRKAGNYWVGKVGDAAISEADLRREKFIAGEGVELGDGKTWTIPIAIAVVSGSTLPKALTLGEDNQTWELRELPEFMQICADARKVFAAFQNASIEDDGRMLVQFDLQESLQICVRALAVNYRVSAVEIDMLGLLTTDNRWGILKAITDYFAVERYSAAAVDADREKKDPSHPVASPMSDGAAAA